MTTHNTTDSNEQQGEALDQSHVWIDGPYGSRYHCVVCGVTKCDDHGRFDTCQSWAIELGKRAQNWNFLSMQKRWRNYLACASLAAVEGDADLYKVASRVLRWLYATMNPKLPIDKSLLKVSQFEIHAELERAILDAHAAQVYSRIAAASSPPPAEPEGERENDKFYCENCERDFTESPHATDDGYWLCHPCWEGLQ